MRLIPRSALILSAAALALPAALAAPAACTPASIRNPLKGPVMTSYETKIKDQKIGNQVIKGRTSVSTTTIKSIPNGVQLNVTDGTKTTVIQSTCVNGKTVTTIDGKAMPTDIDKVSRDVQVTGPNTQDFADTDFSKRKVGEVWSGKLSSVNTAEVTSETTYKNKLVSMEKVTTPAGTFDTYKVQMTLDMKMTYKNMPKGMKMPNMNSSTVTTTWYAREAAHMIIKSESNSMNMTLLKYRK